MNTFGYRFTVLFLVVAALAVTIKAQSPSPMIVQAATASTGPVANPTTDTSESITAAIKTLQNIKAANEETLKKQDAALQKLDELQKAADEIKIFAKRS